MKKILALILVMMILSMVACSDAPTKDTTESGETAEIVGTATEETTEEETATEITEPDEESDEITVVGEGTTVFSLSIVDLDSSETKYEVHTDKTIVGTALLDLGLTEGDESTYGLYITATNGIAADWNADQTY